MPNGDSAPNLFQSPSVEHTPDQSQPGMSPQFISVGRDDSGRLLAPVLERVKPQIGQRDGLFVTPDAEQAAMMSYR